MNNGSLTCIWNPQETIENQVHYPLTVLTMTIYRSLYGCTGDEGCEDHRDHGIWRMELDPQPGGIFSVKNLMFGKKATSYFPFLGPVVLGWPQRLL